MAIASIASCHNASQAEHDAFAIGGSTMGTSWSVLWVADTSQARKADKAIVESAINAELSRIDALMSTWNPDSELSAFNALRSVEPVKLHTDTLRVIDTAVSVSRLTNGSYDITLQPVIELWGFNRETGAPTPDDNDIRVALGASGYQQLVRVGNTARKRVPELALDVSSLAKGFAVDQLGEVIERNGIARYLIDIGGEVRARGTRADGSPWRVGVESPEGEVSQLIALQDAHVASSGSYRNYRFENGKRLSHIIDGASGRPITHDLVAVTVVHEDTMQADAWATALLVVGESRALDLIDQQTLIAQLTYWRDGKFEQYATPEFDALLIVE